MKIQEIRRANLRAWATQNGTPAKEKSYFSQVLSGTAPLGERAARRLERDYKMAAGSLDLPPDTQSAVPAAAPAPTELAWPFPSVPQQLVASLAHEQIRQLEGALMLALGQMGVAAKAKPPKSEPARGQVYEGSADDPFADLGPSEKMPWEPGWKPTKAEDLPALHRISTDGGVVANVAPGAAPAANDKFEKVPELGDVRLAAGEGIENEQEIETGFVQFRRSFLQSFGSSAKKARVVYAKGDSMAPIIQDGAALLVLPDDSITLRDLAAGGVWAINYDGKMIVKTVAKDRISGRWVAVSFNPAHPNIPLEDGHPVRILGRVVWAASPLREDQSGQWVRHVR